ncbi:protein mono-ADP-ribosyltransferase PARP15-like isoform X2 [Mytilus galloprovincialis]|uniref:protein mono-ADP-ribosyltransferase PARP15-like isoform X2 n=1 Tax=Mytilus galloprovincialis TaxID=29158 RepID=UPI003F7CC3B4
MSVYKEIVIMDPVLKDFSEDKKILMLEEQFAVKIDVDKAIGRIKIKGLLEYLPEAVNEVQKIIRYVDKQKLEDSAILPQNWAPMGQNEAIKIVTLQSADKEYQDVVRDLQSNSGKGGRNFNVIQIQKIQNRCLQHQYVAKKRLMDSTNDTGTKNERRLWHGTPMDTIDSINTYGFDRSFCGRNVNAFGSGISFAVNPAYATQWALSDSKGHRRMYLCKVLVGDFIRGDNFMKVTPPKPGADGHIVYDSAVDNIESPNLFVVFNDTQAYPEYLIVFQ